MGTILKLKNTTIGIDDTASMRGSRVRLGTLPRTLAVFDFERQLTNDDVAVESTIQSMLPSQTGIRIAGSFADALTYKGLRLTSSTSNESAILPDVFKLNWETGPSYMLSFWYTHVATVSSSTFAPFIGWCNRSTDLSWAFGPWGSAGNCTFVLENTSADYGGMAAVAGVPQLATAFVHKTGIGSCSVDFYKNASFLARRETTYREAPTSSAGSPRIGRMPSLNGTYSGVVHSCQVAKIPATGIADESGWVAQEYMNHAARYTV